MTPDDAELVLDWVRLLDEIDYLTLLRLGRPKVGDDIPNADVTLRRAFHDFALAFHPDRHLEAADEVRRGAGRIFARGSEAYRVLLDPLLRQRYLTLLHETGVCRLSAEEQIVSQAYSSRTSSPGDGDRNSRTDSVNAANVVPPTFASLTRSAAATPFAKRADELLALGDIKQAKLQLRLALLKDGKNPYLEQAALMLDTRPGQNSSTSPPVNSTQVNKRRE